MKKSYLMIAAAATLLTACASNDTFKESINENNPQPFTFSAYADKVTKGTNSSSLQDFYTVFAVYGYKNVTRNGQATDETVFSKVPNEYFTSTDITNDKQYTYSQHDPKRKPADEWGTTPAAGWYYEDVRYWDKTANSYAFFAIAPYEVTPAPSITVAATDANIQIGSSNDKYDISTEKNLAITGTPAIPQATLAYSGFNKDYMLADKSEATTSDVTLTFHHILAKLNVKIELSDNYKGLQELKVSELKIDGLAKKGFFNYTTNFTTKGWATSEYYYRDINSEFSLTAATNYSGKYWIETLIFPQVTTCKAIGLQKTSEDLDDMYLYIKYYIGDEKYEAYYDFANIWGATVVNNGTNNATNSYEFKQGSEYNLTLTVGPDPIHFDAQVTEWANAQNPIAADLDI